jgi:hypothetical protein
MARLWLADVRNRGDSFQFSDATSVRHGFVLGR